MKIVKVNGRHKEAVRNAGFTHAFRFTSWTSQAVQVEQILKKQYNTGGWLCDRTSNWYSAFGVSGGRTRGSRPYWVYVRGEQVVSFVLLMLEVDQ